MNATGNDPSGPPAAPPAICVRGASRMLVFCFLAAAAVSMVWLWSPPLADSTEARHAEVGREFAEGGDWLVPRLNYQPHLTKPPLTDWLVALGILVFGQNEFGARFFNALTAALGLGLAAAFAARMGGRSAGLAAGLFYLVTPVYLVLSQTISVDILLATLATGACWAVWEASRPDCARPRTAVLAFWLCLALGALAKGHIVLLVVLAPVLAWVLAGRRWVTLRRLAWPPAIAAFLVLALPWFACILVKFPDWLSSTVSTEFVSRTLGRDGYATRSQAVGAFLGGTLPGLPLALAWFLERRGGGQAAPAPAGGGRALLAFWIALPLAVFAAVRFQRANYIAPLVPAAAIAAGLAWARLREEWPAAGRLRKAAALAVPVLALLAAGGGVVAGAAMPDLGAGAFAALAVSAGVLAAAAAAALVAMVRRGPAAAGRPLAVAALALWALAMPLLEAGKERRSARSAVQALGGMTGAGERLLLYDTYLASANFYLRAPLDSDGADAPGERSGDQLQAVLDARWAGACRPEGRLVLLWESDMRKLRREADRHRTVLRPAWRGGGLMLVRVLGRPDAPAPAAGAAGVDSGAGGR